MNSNIPLSIYIHIPWCLQKCPYCDFNSHTLDSDNNPLLFQNYIDCLIDDLISDQTYFNEQREIETIFIGGGTPSLFPPKLIHQLLTRIEQRFHFKNDIEITLEANPGAIDNHHIQGYLAAGINRLSIGIQSFNNSHLKKLGRIHTANDAITAVSLAKRAGFKNINIDIMFGLINQTPKEAIADIYSAISLETTHLSYYQLTIEPNTFFAKKTPAISSESVIEEITTQTFKELEQAGFDRYEVSAWSKNSPAKHNLNYWQHGDYLGIGAGAHGKITQYSQNELKINRTTKIKHPKSYLNQNNIRSIRLVENSEKPFEFMLNGLRLKNGIALDLIESRGGFSQASVCDQLQYLEKKELITTQQGVLKPTEQGYLFLNDVITHFIQ